jgi:hypothetical protein
MNVGCLDIKADFIVNKSEIRFSKICSNIQKKINRIFLYIYIYMCIRLIVEKELIFFRPFLFKPQFIIQPSPPSNLIGCCFFFLACAAQKFQ